MAPVIVDTAWVGDRLEDQSCAVVDVRQPYFYAQGHVPGSLNLPEHLLYGHGGEAPSAEELANRLGSLGITRDTHIVTCDDGGSYGAARLFWVLRYFGHHAVSVMDGGVTKWRSEGRDWEYTETARPPATYQVVAPDTSVRADIDAVMSALGAPDAIVLDVRSPAEYLGRQLTAARNGHIPGAVNVDWVNNLERVNGSYYRFRSTDELRALYETAGVTEDKRVVLYCQAGGRTSATFAVLKSLGYFDVTVYPAGWQEWGNRGDTPIDEG